MENLFDFITKLAVTVASILGSSFVVYKFKKAREAEGILQIEVDLNVNNYSGKHLVDVSIEVSNVGKAASFISSDVYKHALLMVRKVSCGEGDSSLKWEQFENQKLIDDVPYLDIY